MTANVLGCRQGFAGVTLVGCAVYSLILCERSSSVSASSSPAGFPPTPEERGNTKDLHFLQMSLLLQLPSLPAATSKTSTLPNIFLMNILITKRLQSFVRLILFLGNAAAAERASSPAWS